MVTPISLDSSVPGLDAASSRTLLDLMQEDKERGDFDSVLRNLLLQLNDVKTDNLQAVYPYIFYLLDQVTNSQTGERIFSPLEERLKETQLLANSEHFVEEQRMLACKLGKALLHAKGPSLENYLQAMEYYAVYIQLEADDLEAHRMASHLLLQACLDSKSFEEQIQAAEGNPKAFGILIDRLEVLGKTFCASPEDARAIKAFYDEVVKSLNKIRVEKNTPYKEHLLRLQTLIPNPPHTPGLIYPTANYRQTLEELREHFRTIPQEPKGIRHFQEEISQRFRVFFDLLERDLLLLLGPAPCQYQIRAMGSLGREEPCPFSDVELMVLLKEKNSEIDAYFTRFIHFLDLQLRSLCEAHSIPVVFPAVIMRCGLEIDSGGNPAIAPGLRGDPKTFVASQQKPLDTHDGILLAVEHTALRSGGLLQTSGQGEQLFCVYKGLIKEALKKEENGVPLAKYKALRYLKELYKTFTVNTHKGKERMSTLLEERPPFAPLWAASYSGTLVPVKDAYVAPLYHGLSLLALYFGIEETNTLDSIDALLLKKVFTPTTAVLLREAVAAIYLLRVQTHVTYQRKKETIEGQNTQLEKIYWLVLRPLYQSLAQGLSVVQGEPTKAHTEHFEKVFHERDFIDVAFEEACQFTTDKNPNGFAPLIPCLISHFKNTQAPIEQYLPYFKKLSHNLKLESLRKVFFCEACKFPRSEALYAIPNREGMRFSYAKNYERFYKSLMGVTQTTPTTVKILSPCLFPGSLYTAYLTPATIQALDLNQEGNLPKKPNQAHPVVLANGLYFKQNPGNSLMEYAIHNFFSRLAGDLTPPNELVRFEVAGKAPAYPVLISQEIFGKTLKVALQDNGGSLCAINVPRLTWFLLGSILTRPGDGHLSNYIFNQGDLFCIDNDLSFVEPVFRSFFGKEINFCSALFFLFSGPLDTKTLQEFVTLDVDAILNGWIEDVIATEQKYTQLFTAQERQALYDKDPNNRITLTILFKEGALATLNLQFRHLQNYLKSKLRQNQLVTALDLLSQLICIEEARTSTIGPIIRAAYEKTTGSIEDKLKQAVGRKAEASLTSAQYHEKVFRKIPTWQEINAKQVFSPAKARQELLQALLQHDGSFHITKAGGEKVALQADFYKLTEDGKPDDTRQALVLKALHFWAGQSTYTSITLRNCAVLDSANLLPFLQDTVQHLDLSYCPRIASTDLITIQAKCPRLKELFLDGCETLGFLDAGMVFSDYLVFENLHTLSLNHCSKLRSIKVKAPQLWHLQIRDTTALAKVDVDAEKFPRVENRGSSCMNFQLPSPQSQESLQAATALYSSQLEACLSARISDIAGTIDKLAEVVSRLEQEDGKRQFHLETLRKCLELNNRVALSVCIRNEPLSSVAFGKEMWATYFGDVGEVPPLPPDIEVILASPCPFWKDKQVFETHMLTLIPECINGQQLTLKLMGELVKAPREGHATKYSNFRLGEYADPPVAKAHWVLMTCNVLEGTRSKSYEEQEAIVGRNALYKVPTILDAAVSTFVEYMRSGAGLYGGKPRAYTRCQEKYDSKRQLAVGGVTPAGLSVDCGALDTDGYYIDGSRVDAFFGVTCVREFVLGGVI